MAEIRSESVQQEVEAFIAWLYKNDYLIGWVAQCEIEVADEKERKQIVEKYLREFEATGEET